MTGRRDDRCPTLGKARDLGLYRNFGRTSSYSSVWYVSRVRDYLPPEDDASRFGMCPAILSCASGTSWTFSSVTVRTYNTWVLLLDYETLRQLRQWICRNSGNFELLPGCRMWWWSCSPGSSHTIFMHGVSKRTAVMPGYYSTIIQETYTLCKEVTMFLMFEA